MFDIFNNKRFKIYPVLIILFATISLSIMESNAVDCNNATDLSKRIQSRRRRYLVFPEGSSLQLGTYKSKSHSALICTSNRCIYRYIHFEIFGYLIKVVVQYFPKKKKIEKKWNNKFNIPHLALLLSTVYDLVISIPDYTNYVVTGVTTALAWGLPYKPTYPEVELQDQYEQGRLPILNRRHYDTNTTNNNNNYVDNSDRMESITPKFSAMVDGGGGAAMESNVMEMNRTRQQQHLLNSFRRLYEMYSNRRRHDNFENVLDGRPNVYYNLNAYEAFGKYLIETYFRPWQEMDAMATAATTATTVKQPYVRFCSFQC